MANFTDTADDKIDVAAVCGAQVRIYSQIYGPMTRRPLESVIDFGNRGQALQYAHEFEEGQKARRQAMQPRY